MRGVVCAVHKSCIECNTCDVSVLLMFDTTKLPHLKLNKFLVDSFSITCVDVGQAPGEPWAIVVVVVASAQASLVALRGDGVGVGEVGRGAEAGQWSGRRRAGS